MKICWDGYLKGYLKAANYNQIKKIEINKYRAEAELKCFKIKMYQVCYNPTCYI